MNHKLCFLNSQVFSFLYNQIFGDTTKIKMSYVYMEIVSGSNNRPHYPELQVHVNIYMSRLYELDWHLCGTSNELVFPTFSFVYFTISPVSSPQEVLAGQGSYIKFTIHKSIRESFKLIFVCDCSKSS